MPQQLDPVISLQSNGSERQTLGMGQATKPLPRLPRGWSRVCHEAGLFLRSIGLGIVVTAFQSFFTKNFSEPEKVAIRQSRVTALLRVLIHALPLGVAIFEIYLNLKGRYVGAHFNKQNYLQFIAKGHEILMQASLATIILSFIRYHISAGKGMPFGAMLGALQFLQVSYLWSVEFWSAIMSKEFQLKKKISFAVLILICIAVAATAGPSSASLLIARQKIWPMKSAYLSLNATFQDIWPDRLDDQSISSDCKIVRLISDTAEISHPCPLSVLYEAFSSKRGFFPLSSLTPFNLSTRALLQLQLHYPSTEYVSDLTIAPCLTLSKNQVCSTIPQQGLLGGLYVDSMALLVEDNKDFVLESYHVIEDNYYQPYTIASCVADIVHNGSDQTPLQFARISETDTSNRNQEIVSVPALTKSQSIDEIPGDSTQFRVGWVDLPQDIFSTRVPRAIIVHPQSSYDSSYSITTCTLNAGWGSSTILTHGIYPSQIRSHMSHTPPSWNIDTYPEDTFGYLFVTRPNVGNISNFSYPKRRLNISKSWMEFISPTVILFDNSTTSPISIELSQLPSQPSEFEVAWILSLFFSSALGSHGVGHNVKVFEKLAEASMSCKACQVFEIKNIIFGWTYTAQETTTKLAIAVMLTYCALVVAHIIYSAISGVSSTAWDSVAELVALAMNSSPSEILQNTCAGIVGRRAYQTHVRVLKTSEKHLELVFGKVKDPNADVSKLIMNEKYGSIAGGKDDEAETLTIEGQGGTRKRALSIDGYLWSQRTKISRL